VRRLAVALGNWGSPEAVPALVVALNDEEPLVRGHAAWALGRIGTEAARQALRGREEAEDDAWVQEEITSALGDPAGRALRGTRTAELRRGAVDQVPGPAPAAAPRTCSASRRGG